MNFYKNVIEHRGKLLVRGIHDGKEYKEKIDYSPTLYAITQQQTDFQTLHDKYNGLITARGQLMIDMLPPQAPQQGQAGGAAHNVKPIEALKPSFALSFDNSPTELAAWMAQFKAYYETSRLHILPVQQQQAF